MRTIPLDGQVLLVKGFVNKAEDQRYSTTHVSGGGAYTTTINGIAHTTSTPVSSTVRHHQIQKIWITDETGREECYRFYNTDIDVREGHRVVLIYSRDTQRLYRFKNASTGYWWRIRGYAPPDAFSRIWQLLKSLVIAALLSPPFLNPVAAILALNTGLSRKDFKLPGSRMKTLAALVAGLVLICYVPLLPQFRALFQDAPQGSAQQGSSVPAANVAPPTEQDPQRPVALATRNAKSKKQRTSPALSNPAQIQPVAHDQTAPPGAAARTSRRTSDLATIWMTTCSVLVFLSFLVLRALNLSDTDSINGSLDEMASRVV